MNFVNVMHKEVYEKVATWLEAAGFDCTASKERTGFSVRFESTNIFIFIHPVREDEAYIHFHALVTKESRTDAEMMEYLIRENSHIFCGAFSLDSENSIWIEYSIVGSYCDRREFNNALGQVASSADEYDDEIIARWGGINGATVVGEN